MSSGPGAFLALGVLTYSRCLEIARAPGGWEVLFFSVVVCLKASKEVIQLIQQRKRAVAGLQRRLVVHDSLDPMSQVHGVFAVVEAVSNSPGVLSRSL